jgi:hypothetical protein
MILLAIVVGTIACWTVFGLGVGILIGQAIRRMRHLSTEPTGPSGRCIRCLRPYDDCPDPITHALIR